MALPNISVFAFILLCVVVIYKYLVHPTFLSPLSRIPNAHPSSHLSPLWILWIRYTGRENRTVFAAHESNGPVIRLGPNEVSVNCVDGGIRTVYAGGFEKHAWYANLFGNYGTPNMFSTTHSRPHSARKRMLSNVYAKSFLQSSPTLSSISSTILYERLLPRLVVTASSTNATQGIDVFQLFSALTMDFVTCYQFGLAIGSNWTQNSRECEHFLNLYRGRTSSKAQFWAGELPNLTKCFKRFGVRMVPRWVDDANAEIEAWCLSMCDAAAQAVSRGGEREEVDVGDEPVVFAQLLSAMEKEREKSSSTVSDQGVAPSSPTILHQQQRLTLASEMLDHLAAGFDTSSITLTYLAWELSRHPSLQRQLRAELRTLPPTLQPQTSNTNNNSTTNDIPGLPSPKDLDALPLLHAVVMETLRLHAAIPGGQPRVTPRGCVLGAASADGGGTAYPVPAGVRVSASAYGLHRNADVFPDPGAWRPQRWLLPASDTDDGRGRPARHFFWAFGSGGRMCVGSNLALLEIKHIVAAVWARFETTVLDDEGIGQRDAYTAGPAGGTLVLRFERAV